MSAVPEAGPDVAVMVALPKPTATTCPAWVNEATPASSITHVTGWSVSRSPFSFRTVAENWVASPIDKTTWVGSITTVNGSGEVTEKLSHATLDTTANTAAESLNRDRSI